MDKEHKNDLEDYLEAVESQLNLLETTPLNEGGAYPWSSKMVDQQLFLQNQIDTTKEELNELEENEVLSKNMSFKLFKAIIPKGEEDSDRTFVLDICDEILGEASLRKYPYQFFVKNNWVSIDVDAFYIGHNLIIEYNTGHRRRTLPNDDIPIVTISYKDFGTSRKINRDKIFVDGRLRILLKEYRKI